MPIKKKFASHPARVLAGACLVILIVLLVAAFTASIERVAERSALTLQAAPVYAATPDDQGQVIFEQKCQGCHTIGGGRTVGPGLKGITGRRDREWLVRFIVSPDQLIAQGDPLAKQLAAEYDLPMPNLGLSDDEVHRVLAYIEAQSETEQNASSSAGETVISPKQSAEKSAPLLVGNASVGRDIFTGKIRLQNGGVSCISCHNIDGIGAFGGGTVGKDLTASYSNLGEMGVTSVMRTAPFPLMKAVYAERPLTDDEITHLATFLQETSRGEPAPGRGSGIFIVISIVGCLIIVGILQLLWRRRLSGVRQPLVKGGSK